jgi:hypothetical protein
LFITAEEVALKRLIPICVKHLSNSFFQGNFIKSAFMNAASVDAKRR